MVFPGRVGAPDTPSGMPMRPPGYFASAASGVEKPMCGIAGIVNLRGPSPIDPAVPRAMADAIFHRGPDEDGYLNRPGLAMASRRLSIVGLFDGRQPISNEDGRVSVVFNGELFDYPEVRADLANRGHALRTHADTEIIPHLYEDHGEGVFERLRGQFAVALWDDNKRKLYLARDRFGICPLYWTRQTTPDGDWLLFASEIKALLASGLVPARPDPRGINHLFTFFALPGPVTCFQGIQILLPGHYLTVDLGAREQGVIRDRTYWQIDFPDRGHEEDGHSADVVAGFEQVMLKAVEKRLRADVPVVSYLSGGVDSSIVVALACHVRRREGKPAIPTFTISIQDPDLDERNEAALVARHLNTNPVVVACGPREILQTYPSLILAAEGPVIDTACAALLMLARKVHEMGYKVALTGEGADEWLAGYPWYKVHRLLGFLDVIPGLSLLARRAYLRLSGAPRFPWRLARRTHDAVGGPNAWLDIYGLFSASKLRFFSPQMWEQLGDHLPYEDLQLNLDRARHWHPLNRSLYLGARVMLPGLLLASKGDRVAMHSSVETRYPFLDEDVFSYLARLHPRWKMWGLRDKYILRKMSQRWIPAEIAWRRKAMFRAPLDPFHGRPEDLPPFVDQLLSPESLARTGYFDPASVLYWRQRFQNMGHGSNQRTMIEMALVGVVATQLWHHTFIDGSLADLPASRVSANGRPHATPGERARDLNQAPAK
jgi:asparagine synthase (glutamine-hydrolysing)